LHYRLRPYLPRRATTIARRLYGPNQRRRFPLGWPTEDRFVRLVYELRDLIRGAEAREGIRVWPRSAKFSFVITHDVETARGQAFARAIADVDASYGFRSSF